jgi:WD40 repeat protein
MQMFDLPGPRFLPDSLGFSPDGRFLAVWEQSRTVVIGPDGSVRQLAEHLYTQDNRYTRNPAVGFTADGQGVVALHIGYKPGGGAVEEIRVHDVATGEVKQSRPCWYGSPFAFGPKNQWVYMRDSDRGIGILRWNPLTGETLPVFGKSGNDIFQIAVSGDGSTVVASIFESVRVLRFRGDKPPSRASKVLPGEPTHSFAALTASSDGRFVAATGQDIHVWEVESGTRQTIATGVHKPVMMGVVRLPGMASGREIEFHPTKPLLAFNAGAGEVTFWDVSTQHELKRYAWGIGSITALAFSPDGLRCAAAGNSKVVVWDVDV